MKGFRRWLKALPLILMPSVAGASICPEFTEDQSALLKLSHAVGEPFDLGNTMAAITYQESFVGAYIVKINPKDGKMGSYGAMHTQLAWVASYEGVTSSWEAKQDLVPKLLTDDVYALTMGLNHLMKDLHHGWRGMVYRYNGSREYVDKIVDKLVILDKCFEF